MPEVVTALALILLSVQGVRGILRLFQRTEAEASADFKKSLELEPALKSEIDRIREEIGRAGRPK